MFYQFVEIFIWIFGNSAHFERSNTRIVLEFTEKFIFAVWTRWMTRTGSYSTKRLVICGAEYMVVSVFRHYLPEFSLHMLEVFSKDSLFNFLQEYTFLARNSLTQYFWDIFLIMRHIYPCNIFSSLSLQHKIWWHSFFTNSTTQFVRHQLQRKRFAV
jgi:hypothetical protein